MKLAMIFLLLSYLHGSLVYAMYQDDDYASVHLIERFTKHITFLKKFNEKNKNLKNEERASLFNALNINKDSSLYSHELMRLCIKKMKKEYSLAPVVEVWKLFIDQYIAIDGDLFLRELGLFIFHIYEKLLYEYSSFNRLIWRLSQERFDELYHKASTLPIAELIDVLDSFYEELRLILNDYEFEEDIGWGEWIKKYWWVPPVLVAGLVSGAISK